MQLIVVFPMHCTWQILLKNKKNENKTKKKKSWELRSEHGIVSLIHAGCKPKANMCTAIFYCYL